MRNPELTQLALWVACAFSLSTSTGCASDPAKPATGGVAGVTAGTAGTGNAGVTAGASAGVGAAGSETSMTGGSGGTVAGIADAGTDAATAVTDASVDSGSATSGIDPLYKGDPATPTIAIANVACGGTTAGFGATNLMVGGRGVQLDYACGLHKGANVTFILNLHGTMETENIKLYQRGYFSAHKHVDTHNLIVVAPKAIGSQWERAAGQGLDQPHLLAVIDWVYSNFADVNISSMWVGGHSWGAFYAKTFVCDAAIMGKAKGVIAMAGGGSNPQCISRISHIHTIGELDMGGVLPDQSNAAQAHGCAATKSGPEMIGNNKKQWYADCDAGWVHSDYFMNGKMHADSIDDEVVIDILNDIKDTEK